MSKSSHSDPGFSHLDQVQTTPIAFNPDEIESRLQVYASNLYLYIKALLVNILVFLLAAYLFSVPDQALDLLNGIVSDGGLQILWFWISITVLSLSLWYTSIFALANYDLSELKTVKPPEDGKKDIHHTWIVLLPYIFGISIYVIICFAFNGKEIINNYLGWFYLFAGIILAVILYRIRLRNLKKRNMKHLFSKEALDWKLVSNLDKRLIKGSTIVLGVILLITLGMSFMSIKPAYIPRIFNSGAIVCFYLAGISILFNVIWGKVKLTYWKLSTSVIILIIIPIFTLFNNNHHIRLIKEDPNLKPEGIVQDYKKWLNKHMASQNFSPENKLPIYLVAAEGGGIRSMKWTGLVLDQLYKANPDFGNHLYAISGVSGGSVGSVFQQASLHKGNPANEAHSQKLSGAISDDFLAPVTFGLLIPDMVQSLIPFPIHAWDRSRWLEDAWHYSFEKQFEADILNQSIHQYWGNNKENLAHIFLNCTVLETGQKALISDLSLSEKYFAGTVDLGAEITKREAHTGIPLKTAASLSARFPIVTSAGKVKLENGSCQFVDGGYHDNTGLETISQILHMMIQETDSEQLKSLKFSIILIKNSAEKGEEEVSSKDFIVDVSGPLNTLLSHWGNSSTNKIDNTTSLLSSLQQLELDIDLFKFQLDREVFLDESEKRVFDAEKGNKIVLPLGWYLSQRANEEISRQVALINNPGKDPGKTVQGNYEAYTALLEQLK